MERIKQLKGSSRYKKAVDLDFNYKLNLENDLRPLKNNLNKIISVISAEQVFEDERLTSNSYRLSGRLNIITDNTVSDANDNYPDNLDWDPLFDGGVLNTNTPPRTPNNWILQILYPSHKDYELNVGNNVAHRGVTITNLISVNPSGTREQVSLETQQTHKLNQNDYCYVYSINNSSPYHGIHKVEYVGDKDGNNPYKIRLNTTYTTPDTNLILKRIINVSKDDITFSNTSTIIGLTSTDLTGGTNSFRYTKVTTGNFTTLYSANTHNLNEADYVDVRTLNGNFNMNGAYRVEKVIDRYNFIIRNTISLTPGFNLNVIIPYRKLNGVPSDYFIRKFTLLTSNDYEVNKCTEFGTSIYPTSINQKFGIANDTWLFSFLEDIDVSNLLTYDGGEVTQLYFATIKRAGENTFNWSDVTAHWDFERSYATTNSNLEFISRNVTSNVGTIEKKYKNYDSYFGDFFEFNTKELIEKTISHVIHRFSTNDNNTVANGYYIKPFKKLEIRKYSLNIETAKFNTQTVGLPNNFQIRPNGDKIWRDLLEPGFIEEGINGVNYPFLNNNHYVYSNNHIFVRRQEPEEVIEFETKDGTTKPTIVC